MPNYTIHELFTTMNAAGSAQDYRTKARNTWTTWDWICALNTEIRGEAAENDREDLESIKQVLFELVSLKTKVPPFTEEQMMLRYGRKLLELTGQLNDISLEHRELFSAQENNLLDLAMETMNDTDTLQDIEASERQDRQNRVEADAFSYAEWLIAQRRAEEAKEFPDEDRLTDLTSQMYVANYIWRHTPQWMGRNYPQVFRRADCKQISDILLKDPAYRTAIDNERLHHPLPQNVQNANAQAAVAAEEPLNSADLLTALNARVAAAAPENMLTHEIGDPALDRDNVPARLALLRDVKKELDSTGNGYTWYWPTRRQNSTQYEDVRNEIQRQIDRLESGLPIGPADEEKMIQVLNAYSNGREKPGYDYAKKRQENVLRLYAEYTKHPVGQHAANYPTPQSVMYRYNRIRGLREQDPAYVDLNNPPYSRHASEFPGSAITQHTALLNELKANLNQRLSNAGRPLDAVGQLDLQQKFLRLTAIHNIMLRDRAGIYAAVDENRINAEVAQIRNNPRADVHGMITSAVRNPEVMRQAIEAYDFADEQSGNREYYRDPDNFTDPLNRKLRTFSYPTVQERLELAERELAGTVFPAEMTPQLQAQFSRLAVNIYALRHMMEDPNRGPHAHLSDDEFGVAATIYQQDARLEQLTARAGTNADYANTYKDVLLDRSRELYSLDRMTDRLVNGRISDMRKDAADEMRAIPAGQALPDEEAKDAMRDKLVHIAALNNLLHDRDARFPNEHFSSDTLYTSDEIEAAEEDVRDNQTAFMQAIEPYLTGSDQVKQAFEDMTTTRYDRMIAENEAGLQALTDAISSNYNDQITQACDAYRTRFATMIALRNLQRQHGGVNMPVREEILQQEIERVRLSDEYLAVDRMIRSNPNNVFTLHNDFVSRKTIDARLENLTRISVAPEAPAGTLGYGYRQIREQVASLGDPSTANGRAVIAMNVFRAIAYREQMLAAADGRYAPVDDAAIQRRFVELSTSPQYRSLFTRIRNNQQTAVNMVNAFMNTTDSYTMKIDQLRAQAQNQPYADPMVAQINALNDLRYEEVYENGVNILNSVLAETKAGVPLTDAQKDRLLHAAAQIIVSRRAPAGDASVQISDQDRTQQINDLVQGEGELAQALKTAVDKASMNGAAAGDLLAAVSVNPGQVENSLRLFAAQTPAKWVEEAWTKLQAATAAPRANAWTRAEREDLMQTYALMSAMQELAGDPARASQPVSLPEVRDLTRRYLEQPGREDMLSAEFADPAAAVSHCLNSRIRTLTEAAPAQGQFAAAREAMKLQQIVAMRNLQKKHGNDRLIVQDNEIQSEMSELYRSAFFRTLTDPRNPVNPAVTAAELAGKNIDVALEGAYYGSPARKPVLLGDTPENSFAGRRILIADELRHEQALGSGRNAERLHIAELYALSLYNDGHWKENELPDPSVITEQARLIMNLPDFRTAMDAAERSPERREALINALRNGEPAEQITQTLNQLSKEQRYLNNAKDVRNSDLKYDVRAAMVQRDLVPLRSCDTLSAWSTEQEVADAQERLNSPKKLLTQAQAREHYLNFLAANRLYMNNPNRTFFTDAEMAAVRQEVEQDPDIQADLQIALATPKDTRFNVFNLAPSQYWTEIQAMESGRDAFLNAPGGEDARITGLQVILFSLIPIVEARTNGRDVNGRIIANDDLNLMRNRTAFTEEFIVLENALRTDINELDRIKDVIKLPADQFPAAFKKLTDEYKVKYPEADILQKDTLGGEYLKAKKEVLALEKADFANDEAARNKLAHNIREIMTIRNIILNSRYDLSVRRNTAAETDNRRTRSIEAEEAAGKHHITMRLGKPGWLEEQLKDPETAAKYVNIMKGAEDLRRLYGKKLASGRGLIDPLETQLIEQGLDAPAIPHAERQAQLISQIPLTVPGETPAQKTARLKTQLAGLCNLILHADSTAPRDMPQDSVLAEQSSKIQKVPEFNYAVERMAKNDQLLSEFMTKALQGMNSAQMAAELNRLSTAEQLERDPKSEGLSDFLFRLRLNAMNEANNGVVKTAASDSPTWKSNAERDFSLQSFMHYTSMNRLMAQHPERFYFTEAEYADSFLQTMNDETLQRQYEDTAKAGPIGVRGKLFDYGGGFFLTTMNLIENNCRSIDKLDLDKDSHDAFIQANLGQFGAIAWLQENNMVEQNHLTTLAQTDNAASNFEKTPEFKTLTAAAMLHPREMTRFMARLLPLTGNNFRQGLAQVVNEYRAPLNMAERSLQNAKLLGEFADEFLHPRDTFTPSNCEKNLRSYLADTLNIALRKDLPADMQPNAEEFIRQRDEITALPEFKKAVSWLCDHPQELKQLSNDLQNGLAPTHLLIRLNEASMKQQKAEGITSPSSHLVHRLQINMMKQQRSKYWSKCASANVWDENVKKQFREDFLDFIGLDALIQANPNRLHFTPDEIRAARAPFEQNPAFMAKLEETTTTPLVARNMICAFPVDNVWNWTQQALHQMRTVISPTIRQARNMKRGDQLDLVNGVTAALSQVALSKMRRSQIAFDPKTLTKANEDLNATPAFRAMANAIVDNHDELNRIVNEVYSLDGEAFRTKLEEMGRAYLKKYPKAKAQSEQMKQHLLKERRADELYQAQKRQMAAQKVPEAKPPVQPKQEAQPKPEVKQPVQPKPEVKPPVQPKPEVKPPVQPKPEVKQPAEPLNRINIFNEPEPLNAIHEKKLPPEVASRLKPTMLIMPQKDDKNTALGQYQTSAAQLEKTLDLRAASKIPIDDPKFVDTAYHGVLQTVAYLNLADKKEYFNQKAGKEALNDEVTRLQNNAQLQPLKEAIRSGYGKTILDGIKHLENKPKKLEGFLHGMASNPAETKKLLEQNYQRPAPRYLTVPALPKTQVVNDVIPKAPEGQKFDMNSPAGRYQIELNAYQTAIETARERGAKGIGAGYNDTIHASLLRLYSLNQIMAGTKDPTVPIDNLTEQINQKTLELNRNPGSYRYIIEGSKNEPRFRDHVVDIFKKNDSFSKLSEKLQTNAERYLNYDCQKQNNSIEKENSRMIREAEKQKDKGLDNPQV